MGFGDVYKRQVQANFDYFDEKDLIKKFVLANRIQPLVMAIFCNSPFREGSHNFIKSNRIHTWQDTDSDRCGIKKEFLDQSFNIEKYVDFALKVKNYFLKINGKHIDTTSYSFHDLVTKTPKEKNIKEYNLTVSDCCLLYTSPSPRDRTRSRMPSSA